MNAPDRISLLPDDGWSWCEGTPVHEEGRIEYVRADLYATLAAKCEALERERDALDRGLAQAMSDTEAAMRTLWETAARVRSLEEALRKIEGHSEMSGPLRMAHYMRMLALVHEAARAALSDTPREEPTP